MDYTFRSKLSWDYSSRSKNIIQSAQSAH